MNSLDLALIGNCAIGALIDPWTEIVWGCLPRFDGDPVFCSLLRGEYGADDVGYCRIELVDAERTEQHYLENTAVLVTRLYDRHGGIVEVTDFAPRFRQFARMFRPMMIVRRIRPIAGSPRIRVRVRPAFDYGRGRPDVTFGSHHLRYVAPGLVLRLTTDASVTAIKEERAFFLQSTVTLVFGPDETLTGAIDEVGHRFLNETTAYWRQFVRYLGIPFEWQDAVIRGAITLKLNAFDDTGAIIAAMTTSIPESAGSGRNWDYRYCWLRDGYFVVNALSQLGATSTMERFLSYVVNVAAASPTGDLQPVYGIGGEANIDEREIDSLRGYRGMAPVRIGNQACRQTQNDVYGSAILSAIHVFFDRRLTRQGDEMLFRRLEVLGEKAVLRWDQPDAGPWELRGSARIHTFSALMCWAACDRLAKIAGRLGLAERMQHWRSHAKRIRDGICQQAWSEHRGSFVASFGGQSVDASLLQLHDLGFLSADDPRFAATVAAIDSELRQGNTIFRYSESDDFGKPINAFAVCTFWYVNALEALGRTEEARALFENLLSRRTSSGLLAEHIDPATGELWGNFPQTYSMVGLINAAIRLSVRWELAF